MRKKVAEPERLDKYLVNYGDNNDDFKALVLKLLAEFQDVEKIHQLTNVPISTIIMGSITRAAAGSAHQKPKSAFNPRPPSRIAER
jgi:hypothetical protein